MDANKRNPHVFCLLLLPPTTAAMASVVPSCCPGSILPVMPAIWKKMEMWLTLGWVHKNGDLTYLTNRNDDLSNRNDDPMMFIQVEHHFSKVGDAMGVCSSCNGSGDAKTYSKYIWMQPEKCHNFCNITAKSRSVSCDSPQLWHIPIILDTMQKCNSLARQR